MATSPAAFAGAPMPEEEQDGGGWRWVTGTAWPWLVKGMRDWWRIARVPYALVVLLLALIAAASGGRNILLAWGLVALLGLASLWLSEKVRTDRATGQGHTTGDHAGARVRFGIVAVAVGALLLTSGWRWFGQGQDGVFFVGLWVAFLAGGALVSEARYLAAGKRIKNKLTLGSALLVVGFGVLIAARFVPVDAKFLWFVAGGLAITEIGAELFTEDSHGWKGEPAGALPAQWRWMMVVGALLLVAAWWWFVEVGVGQSFIVPLFVVLALLVWLASVDSDALALMLVGAGMLVWASSPAGVTLDERYQPRVDDRYFVVLGDSYISGEGAEQFVSGTNTIIDNEQHTNTCRQAQTAWPFGLADAARGDEVRADATLRHVPSRVLFLGCSGAVTENLHTHPRQSSDGKVHGPAELAQLVEQRKREGLGAPAFIVVSIGGNDAGFGDIGATCVGPGDCSEVGQQFLEDGRREVKTDQPTRGSPGKGKPESVAFIDDDLDAAYNRIQAVIDGMGDVDVPVIAIPYPVPLSKTGPCKAVLLDRHERDFVGGFLDQLNQQVEAAAKRHGFLYMDTMENALVDRGIPLCGDSGGEAGLNFIRLNPQGGTVRDRLNPASWKHNSLHPNEQGHEAMATAAVTWFANHPDLTAPPADPEATHEVPDIDTLMGADVDECVASPECDIEGSRWTLREVKKLYDRAQVPTLLSFVGIWLLLAPPVWRSRRNGLTAGGFLKNVWDVLVH